VRWRSEHDTGGDDEIEAAGDAVVEGVPPDGGYWGRMTIGGGLALMFTRDSFQAYGLP
jgi:hypothetical protein